MNSKRTIEIFSAGCPVCRAAIASIEKEVGSSFDVTVLDMHDATVAERAKKLGIRSVPAVVTDGKLADCCAGRGIDLDVLKSAGLGASG